MQYTSCVRSFIPKLLQVSDGAPRPLEPVPFSGRVDELTLEKWIAESPDLVGEPLLLLGRQLADFQEDQDRLDILAIDSDGEIVLIELKVSENFRVTDLQALAYAGAYATQDTGQLAETLRWYLSRSVGMNSQPMPTTVSVEDARQAIVDFLEIDDFSRWEPSQRVRIKLVAPRFPPRVLKSVKWLGDVYGMPIEAIAVRLFEQSADKYAIAFERVLPLPGEDEFDMTIRQREERKKIENTTRRPSVVPKLVESGHLTDGQTLYIAKSSLLQEHRDLYDASDIAFRVTVRVSAGGTTAKFAWRASEDAAEELLNPSRVAHRVLETKTPWTGAPFSTQVAHAFLTEPAGDTLAQLTIDAGVWTAHAAP